MNDLIRVTCAAYVDAQLKKVGTNWWPKAALLAEGYDYKAAIDEAWVEAKYEHVPTWNMRWDDLIVLGLHPVEAFSREIPVRIAVSGSYDESNADLAHPLNIGLMFARHLALREAAERCISEYSVILQGLAERENAKAVTKYRKRNFGKDNGASLSHIGSRFWIPSWYSPDPREHGIQFRIDKPHAGFDNIALAAWFSDQAMEATLAIGGQVDKLADVATYLGRDARTLLERSAGSRLSSAWNRTGRIPYEDLATLLRLSRREEAERRLRDTKGVRSVLGIVRRDTPRDLMISGLSQLAQMEVADLSTLYGRAPTADELRSVRSQGIVKILYHMPYTLLREVLDEERGEEILRARLLSELGKETDMLRSALAAHERRATLKYYPLLDFPEPQKISSSAATTTFDWDKVFSHMAKRYSLAIEFREQLQKLVPDRIVRVACAAKLFDNNPHVTKALQQLPKWDEVDRLIKSMPVPSTSPDVWVNGEK